MEIGLPYNETFEDPERINELARLFASRGIDGVMAASDLSGRYLLLSASITLHGGSKTEVARLKKISQNLLEVCDNAYRLLQVLDPESVSHIRLGKEQK